MERHIQVPTASPSFFACAPQLNSYLGVCFVCSTQTDISDIHVIRNWPGPLKNSDESSKTPSRTAFLPPKVGTSKEVVAWGFHVTDKMESYSWTKLLLDGTTALTEFDHAMSSADNGGHLGMLRLPPGKTARDVVGHYLREVYTFAFNELQKRFGSDKIRATVIEYWFTVPAIWSDKAKASTLEAARSAGFGSRPGDTVFLVPEPQAAAIATFRDLTKAGELEQIKPGDGILICDCGGMLTMKLGIQFFFPAILTITRRNCRHYYLFDHRCSARAAIRRARGWRRWEMRVNSNRPRIPRVVFPKIWHKVQQSRLPKDWTREPLHERLRDLQTRLRRR